MQVGDTLRNHVDAPTAYIPDADPGRHGGGTYTSHNVEPTLEAYENIFGPSARDIKQDLQRFKRHGRWHLPDVLKGPNQYLTDRVDGLITDPTKSPFTSRILPYKYIEQPDGKIKWNVWSFDEGLASRVPYESAARTLQQSKRSYAGYFIRQGMAIVLEHNFMMTEAGRENFRRQLQQLTGSIQLTNDLDVHVALVLAPSYQKEMNEKYMSNDKSSAQICREFVEMFGFVQKNQNALDILIEEAKDQLGKWGAPMPDFMLCNSKLTFQLTMIPDRTNIVTQGAEGAKRLKAGPEMSSYRGIGIVHSRAFSMETGTPPRDILRRRVRVAEYYRILPHKDNHKRLFQLYNEERDTWSSFTFHDLLQKAHCHAPDGMAMDHGPGRDNDRAIRNVAMILGASAGDDAGGAHHHGEHGAGVHLGGMMHLGSVLQPEEVDQVMQSSLTSLYKQLLTRTSNISWTWEPKPLNDRLVFVPGATDMSNFTDVLNRDLSLAGNRATLPDFIKHTLDEIAPTTQGMMQWNRVKYMINSIATYPRDCRLFSRKLKQNAQYLRMNSPPGFDIPAAGPLLAASTVTGAYNFASLTPQEQIEAAFLFALHVRNYNRYSIPTEIIRPGVTYGDSTTNFDRAIDCSVAMNNPYFTNATLRNLGAWYCPNHFKDGAKTFRCFGDYVGYHMLMYERLLRDFIPRNRQVTASDTWHVGTLLHDIVLGKKNKYPNLYDRIRTDLQTLITAYEGNQISRTRIARELGPLLRQHLTDPLLVPHGFNQAPDPDIQSYWYLPRTTNLEEEVFCPAARAAGGWKQQIWAASPDFQNRLFFSWQAVQELEAYAGVFDTHSPDSPKYLVQFPAAGVLPPVSDRDVDCLFNMLAWRLWADQEIPLEHVYPVNTMQWPPFDHYVFPGLTGTPANFGQGVMMYGDPALAPGGGVSQREARISRETEDIEIVIVRPNIEHYMLGIILGKGGESLGSTFWGQTELSCYDDSMHGIWGMSYKYHERAIVINNKNLIRLWDVAYDGYAGGKDDTAVNWDDMSEAPNSRQSFINATMDVTRPYRGPSMMVMAFNHKAGKSSVAEDGQTHFKRHFNANWPSPVVFSDRLDAADAQVARADFDNLHVVDAQQFRVFNNPLYSNAYRPYKEKMPDFWELHTIRKNAGLAAVENEVSSDALAFQGTMRVVSAETGGVIQEVLGSGHHGPDFIGVASLRAGKGYRLNSQPTQHRLV